MGRGCNHVLSRNLDVDPKPDVAYASDDTRKLVVSINALNGRPSS